MPAHFYCERRLLSFGEPEGPHSDLSKKADQAIKEQNDLIDPHAFAKDRSDRMAKTKIAEQQDNLVNNSKEEVQLQALEMQITPSARTTVDGFNQKIRMAQAELAPLTNTFDAATAEREPPGNSTLIIHFTPRLPSETAAAVVQAAHDIGGGNDLGGAAHNDVMAQFHSLSPQQIQTVLRTFEQFFADRQVAQGLDDQLQGIPVFQRATILQFHNRLPSPEQRTFASNRVAETYGPNQLTWLQIAERIPPALCVPLLSGQPLTPSQANQLGPIVSTMTPAQQRLLVRLASLDEAFLKKYTSH